MELISAIIENWEYILAAAAGIVASASALVRILILIARKTETKVDDNVLESILNFLQTLALNPKKGDARK